MYSHINMSMYHHMILNILLRSFHQAEGNPFDGLKDTGKKARPGNGPTQLSHKNLLDRRIEWEQLTINGSRFGTIQLKSVVYRTLVLEKHGDSPRKSRGFLGFLLDISWGIFHGNLIFQIFHGNLIQCGAP